MSWPWYSVSFDFNEPDWRGDKYCESQKKPSKYTILIKQSIVSHKIILKRKQIRCHAQFQILRPEIAIGEELQKALCLPLWQSFPTSVIWPHELFINIWKYFPLSQIGGCVVNYWHPGVESRVAATQSKIQKKAVL